MRRVKQISIIFMLCLLCVGLVGCGSSEVAKKAAETSKEISSHEVTKNPIKALFSKKYVLPKTMEKMQKKQAKELKEAAIKDINDQSNKKGVLVIFLIICVLAIGLGIFFKFILPLLFVGKVTGKVIGKEVAKAVATPAVAVPSNRLKVDYPKLLAQDCAALGLDYNTVLADFDGNAEKAYETLHVQVLQQQYG